jgi:hypothetical protein
MSNTPQTTITVNRSTLEYIFKEWELERGKVEALAYAISASLRKGEDDRFNERMLSEVITDILGSTETITMYKKELLGDA